MKIDPEYQKLLLQIKQDGEKYADRQMQTVYGVQKDNLTELHKYLGLLYVKNAVDGLLNVTPTQKKAVLFDVDQQIISAQKGIGSAEVQAVSEILKHNYGDMYYKTAYVMDSGLKAGIKFGMLKPEFTNAAVNSPVDGEIFSDRIWNNKAAVADKLKESFVNALNGDTTIDKIGQEIQRAFNVQAYESQRLVHTENARVQSAAIDDIGKSAGCSQQMFCATLEANTCSECAELDGKYFDIDDDSKPGIPVHPECRCVYINVPPVPGWTPQSRRDNETGEDIGYEDYAQWVAEKGISSIQENNSNSVDTATNDAIIGSEDYRDKFDIFSNNKANSTLCRETRRAIRQNSGTTNETAVLVDSKGNILAKQRTGSYGGTVDLNSTKDASENSIVITHNHPGSTSFSDDDIALLMDNPQIKTIVAGGHDGTVYKLSIGHGTRLSIDKNLGFNAIIPEYRNLLDNLKDPHMVVAALANKYGWEYEKI